MHHPWTGFASHASHSELAKQASAHHPKQSLYYGYLAAQDTELRKNYKKMEYWAEKDIRSFEVREAAEDEDAPDLYRDHGQGMFGPFKLSSESHVCELNNQSNTCSERPYFTDHPVAAAQYMLFKWKKEFEKNKVRAPEPEEIPEIYVASKITISLGLIGYYSI